jgi:spore maturation protein CgeB
VPQVAVRRDLCLASDEKTQVYEYADLWHPRQIVETTMRFLILNTDYPGFLRQHYTHRPKLSFASFETQMFSRAASWFSVADCYTNALHQHGHEAWDVHANNIFAQHAWAREHAPHIVHNVAQPLPGVTRVPWTCNRGTANCDWLADVLVEQVKAIRPHVVLNQAMDGLPPALMHELRPHVPVLAGQQASPPLDESLDWRVYDLCVSSFPWRVQWFREQGIRGELNRLAFDARVLDLLPAVDRDLPLTFVGSFFDMHRSRTRLLERVAERFPLQVWGPAPKDGFANSPLARCYRGEAWGLDMLKILRRSQITLNHHGDVPPYANNFRLYEATGCGAMLVTDWKQNLHEMFDIGREVTAYRDDDECLAMIERYFNDHTARHEIAAAGHRRTITEHTFTDRMAAFARMVEPLVSTAAVDRHAA